MSAAIGDDGRPAAVHVTGSSEPLLRSCVARAVKSVEFAGAAGQRVELEVAPSAGE